MRRILFYFLMLIRKPVHFVLWLLTIAGLGGSFMCYHEPHSSAWVTNFHVFAWLLFAFGCYCVRNLYDELALTLQPQGVSYYLW